MKRYKLEKGRLEPFLLENAVSMIMIVFVIFMIIRKPSFISWGNICNIINECAVYGITACAMTTAIICAEFDLSASSIFAWSTVLCCMLCNAMGFFPALTLRFYAARFSEPSTACWFRWCACPPSWPHWAR